MRPLRERRTGREAGRPYRNPGGGISVFTKARKFQGLYRGEMSMAGGTVRFPLRPFRGLMGVVSDTDVELNTAL